MSASICESSNPGRQVVKKRGSTRRKSLSFLRRPLASIRMHLSFMIKTAPRRSLYTAETSLLMLPWSRLRGFVPFRLPSFLALCLPGPDYEYTILTDVVAVWTLSCRLERRPARSQLARFHTNRSDFSLERAVPIYRGTACFLAQGSQHRWRGRGR